MTKFTTITDAAKRLGYSESGLRARVQGGFLGADKVGRRWRIPEEAVRQAEQGRETSSSQASSAMAKLHRRIIQAGAPPIDVGSAFLALSSEFAVGCRSSEFLQLTSERFGNDFASQQLLAILIVEGLVHVVPGPRPAPDHRGRYASLHGGPYDTYYLTELGASVVRNSSDGPRNSS